MRSFNSPMSIWRSLPTEFGFRIPDGYSSLRVSVQFTDEYMEGPPHGIWFLNPRRVYLFEGFCSIHR